jgi:hypothetical protein
MQSTISCSTDHDYDSSCGLPVTHLLWEGLRYINGQLHQQQQRWWDPRGLLKAVAKSHGQFAIFYQQQDPQYLMTALLDVLEQEQDSKKTLLLLGVRLRQPYVRGNWSWRSSSSSSPLAETTTSTTTLRLALVNLSSAVPPTERALSSSFFTIKIIRVPYDR